MKPLKLPNEIKEFNTLANRIAEAESKVQLEEEHEETVSERIHRCAQLRHARVEEYKEFVPEIDIYHLVWLMSTPYEIGDEPYEIRFSPEERYPKKKQDWLHHETSWFRRELPEEDESCCNKSRCIPSCRYYAEEGRIEDDELIQEHQRYWAWNREKGEQMLAQKKREHEEWLALTEEERQERIQQQIVERKEEEAWNMANQRGELGPINQRKPPQWWLEQYRRQKQ